MGVHGLWNLLESSGKPVPLESLENKVLAVDVSIWLHQLVAGYQDSRGNAVPNAHLLGLFHRICKLLFYKIKPVFVFDGNVPLLKKQTVAERQRQKSRLREDADDVRLKLAKNILKYTAVKEVLGSDSAGSRVTLSKSKLNQDAGDIFKLPPLQTTEVEAECDNSDLDGNLISSDSYDSSDEESPVICKHVHADLHSIDVKGKDFQSLPADIRHDILTELKETRKQSSWGRMHEMPQDSDQFSSFQMKRLIKRRNFQVSLEEAEKEMGGHTLSLGELEALLNEQGVLVNKNVDLGKRIASDSVTRLVYIRDEAKKKLFSTAKYDDHVQSQNSTTESQSEESLKNLLIKASASTSPTSTKNLHTIIEEDEFEQDWSSDSDIESKKQTNTLASKSRVDLARDFMFVASALTQDQIDKIVQQRLSPRKQSTAVVKNDALHSNSLQDQGVIDQNFRIPGPSTSKASISSISHSIEEDLDYIGIISDESEGSDDQVDNNNVDVNDKQPLLPLEVIVQPDKEYNIEEDLFADVFFNIEHDLKQAQRKVLLPQQILVNEIHQEVIKNKFSCEGRESVTHRVKKAESDDGDLSSGGTQENTLPNISATIDCSREESDFKSLDPYFEIIKLDKEAPVKELSSGLSNSSASNEEQAENPDAATKGSLASIDVKTDSNLKSDLKHDDVDSDSINSKYNQVFQDLPTDEIILEEISSANEKASLKDPQMQVSKIQSNTTRIDEENTSVCNDGSLFDQDERKDNMVIKKSSPSRDEVVTLQNSDLKESPLSPAAPKLREVDLLGMQASLQDRHMELLMEAGKSDRMAASITQQMCSQAQDLLRLFGLPYLIAPMEAEAQCAFLDLISLTDGTISDDSDIWLFGGRKVYKNFFNQKKHVMQFTDGDIHNSLRLARHHMILLALLTGSDYTTGLTGVGPVTALEILAAFPCGSVDGDQAAIDDLVVGLKDFREWLKNGRPAGPGTTKLRNKLKDLQLGNGFPSSAVIEAYLRPTVDESREKFTWGKPDVASLQAYTREKFGWTRLKTDEILTPVINKINERNSQSSLDSYIQINVKLPQGNANLSKRVQKAVHRLAADNANSDTEDDPLPPKKKRKVRTLNNSVDEDNTRRNNKKSKTNPVKSAKNINELNTGCSTSTTTGEFIPQREQDKLNALKSKLKAIELFRSSKHAPVKTKTLKRPKRMEKAVAELSESSSD